MTDLSNSALAAQVSALVASWDVREHEFRDWVGGAADGGPDGDGRYPLSNGSGFTAMVLCPAAITDEVSGPAAEVSGILDSVLAASTSAATSATLALARVDLAAAARDASVAAKDLSVTAKDQSATYAANALTYSNNAHADATAAHTDALAVAAAIATMHAPASTDISDASSTGRSVLTGTASVGRTALGLGNVDNTSDANKPVSTATQTALNLKADLAAPAFTGNPTVTTQAAGNNSTRVASTAYVDAAVGAVIAAADAMVYKGNIDCSANPNYPAADRGWTYKVSVAGKIGGASGINVEVNDTLLCTVDGTATGNHATVGSSWNISQGNLDGAVIGPASSVNGNLATFSGTGGKVIQDSGRALPAGTLVGTSDAQTLTNKTLTAPSISSPTGIVKGDVGLGNVDNTSDVNKPVSTAQAAADALKLDINGGTMTGLLVTPAAASGGAGLRLPHGSDPSSPTNGDLWSKTTGLFGRINGTTRQFATLDGTETLSNKTITGPSVTATGNIKSSGGDVKVAGASGTTYGGTGTDGYQYVQGASDSLDMTIGTYRNFILKTATSGTVGGGTKKFGITQSGALQVYSDLDMTFGTGYILTANDYGLVGALSTGGFKSLVKMNTSNIVEIGESALGAKIVDVLYLPGIPTYADEAAATTAGLSTNKVYKTSTGELRIKL